MDDKDLNNIQEDDFSFVTIDEDDALLQDAVMIDVDGADDLWGAVTIDYESEGADLITLSDDTVMLLDADMVDINSTDIDLDCSDISFIL